MITSKIKRKTNNLDKLAKRIKALSSKKIKSGYFADQGQHPTSGMAYTDLAYLHASGTSWFPDRDVRYDTIDQLKGYNFKPLINKYLFKDLPLSSVVDTIAFRAEDIAQSLFGVPSINNPDNSDWWAEQKGANTPLVQYGYLRDAWESRVVGVGD